MSVTFEQGWRPGVIGEIASLHGVYYAREWGFGAFFEAKVAAELAAFVSRYDPARDLLLTARRDGAFLASVTIDGSDPDLASGESHLRWFITSDAARGSGVGGGLMTKAMDFLREAGFRSCYLTTFQGLDAARGLYERHGFELTVESDSETWGVTVREQRFELAL